VIWREKICNVYIYMHHHSLLERKDFLISLTTFLVMFTWFLLKTGRWRKILKLIKRPIWLFNIIFISGYCFYIFNMADKRDKQYENLVEATKKAILALIIAFFAHLDTMVSTFWVVWMAAFYMTGFT